MSIKIWDFWAKHYEHLYAQHFALGPTRKLVINHLKSIIPTEKTVNILDIGCGIGQLAAEIADIYPLTAITAIDPSPIMIKRAKTDYARNNINYKTTTINDVEEENYYDLIISTHSFPYIPDKTQAMQRIYKILKANGNLLIIHGNTQNLYDMLFYLGVKSTVSHAEYLSTKDLSKLMETAGFTINSITPLPKRWFIPSINLVDAGKKRT